MKKTNQDIDYKWFCDNISQLFFNYGYSYLAIKNKKIIGSYSTLKEGFLDMLKRKVKIGTFIIQRCAPTNDENLQYVASMNFL